MQTKRKIQETFDCLGRLLKNIISTTSMVRGSFCVVYRRCGKQTCWCANPEEKGHVSKRITWNEKQQPQIKNISIEEEQWAKSTTESYHAFRKWRRELRAKEKRLESLLDDYENTVVKNTRKEHGF